MKYGVKMTTEDQLIYEDNCLGDYKFTCSNTIPKDWIKSKKRKENRESSLEKKRLATEEKKREQRELDRVVTEDAMDCGESDLTRDYDFEADEPSTSERVLFSDKSLRSSSSNTTTGQTQNESSEHSQFPPVKVRTGRKAFNESVIRCLIQCLSQTSASSNEVCRLVTDVANKIFGRSWSCAGGDDMDEGENGSDSHSDDEFYEQRPKSHTDMAYVLPIRRTIMRYLEDASFLNLEYVARQLLEKKDNVVTCGLDDTSKAAGHRYYDIKTDHITIIDKDGTKNQSNYWLCGERQPCRLRWCCGVQLQTEITCATRELYFRRNQRSN